MIIFDTLLELLAEQWGNIASAIGAVLTIIFSRGAKRSADAAKLAAANARARVFAVDWVVYFLDVIAQIDEIMESASTQSTQHKAISSSVKLKSKLVTCLNQVSPIVDIGLRKRIQRSPTVFSAICQQIELSNSSGATLDLAKIRKTLSDQRDIYSLALDMAKQSAMGEQNEQ